MLELIIVGTYKPSVSLTAYPPPCTQARPRLFAAIIWQRRKTCLLVRCWTRASVVGYYFAGLHKLFASCKQEFYNCCRSLFDVLAELYCDDRFFRLPCVIKFPLQTIVTLRLRRFRDCPATTKSDRELFLDISCSDRCWSWPMDVWRHTGAVGCLWCARRWSREEELLGRVKLPAYCRRRCCCLWSSTGHSREADADAHCLFVRCRLKKWSTVAAASDRSFDFGRDRGYIVLDHWWINKGLTIHYLMCWSELLWPLITSVKLSFMALPISSGSITRRSRIL